MGMIKAIHANVSEKDFYDFKARCESEGVSLADGFAGIVKAYARGAMLTFGKKKSKKATKNQYVEDHKVG